MAWEKIHQLDESERLEQIRRIIQLRLEAKEIIKASVMQGKVAAVLLPGDPSFFSPMEWFVKNIPDQLLEIIPGISSVNAASAAMKRSLVSGQHTESVIITTPEAVGGVLPGELVDQRRDTVEELARLQTNLVFFMALFNIGSLIARLCKIYPPKTPAAVVYKAGIRDEEKVVMGTLENIEKKVCGEQQQFKGLFLVGPFINIHHKSLWERFYDKVQ
jgi:precorrin-4 methylase